MEAHHSFTRAAYDECELKKQFAESTAQFDWATDYNVIESKESCFEATAPFMHNPFKSIPSDAVDIESELKGQTRNLSRCPENKFDPTKFKPINVELKECKDKSLVPEYTRSNRSCNVLSGISINRFNPLCEDYTVNVQSNTYIGSNTRLLVKDTFEAKRKSEREKLKLDLKHLDKYCQVGKMQCAFIESKQKK